MWTLASGLSERVSVSFRSTRGPFHEQLFRRNSNPMEIWFSYNSIVGKHIATQLCACHDSIAVETCAKLWSVHFTATWITAEWIFYRIWIRWKKRSWSGSLDYTPLRIEYICMKYEHCFFFIKFWFAVAVSFAHIRITGFVYPYSMMTSSNGNIFRVTGPLWKESTGPRWIPLTNASDAGL